MLSAVHKSVHQTFHIAGNTELTNDTAEWKELDELITLSKVHRNVQHISILVKSKGLANDTPESGEHD